MDISVFLYYLKLQKIDLIISPMLFKKAQWIRISDNKIF
jgi:hypothetical protein